MTFQDGTAFDAGAVKANLDRLSNQSLGLKRNSLYKMIDHVTVVSPTTVKVHLSQSFGAFINTLAPFSGDVESEASGSISTGKRTCACTKSEPGHSNLSPGTPVSRCNWLNTIITGNQAGQKSTV
ncbi:ABC transporter substrate-binding protein [Vibrio sp. PP-XX7]